ncbi:MAG: 16S rRNA processing protein RimM [Clostridiales bacterium]|nr:16S rRNA processing protein RimM [Clostridiales bacterium]
MVIGEILKPHGIRGEIKVKPLTSDPTRFTALKSVTVDGRLYRVKNVRLDGNMVYLCFDGVSSMNDAETLRGKMITIDRASAVELSDGEFFIADLIGADIFTIDGGTTDKLGKIMDIKSFGAADVFEVIDNSGKSLSFPFLKKLNPKFDEEKRALYIDFRAFNEVAVRED